jgi:hypothetical protein
MNAIKIKLNRDLKGVPCGTVLTLELDPWGNIKDRFWRRRLRDSAHDECVEVVTEKEKIVKKEETKS